MSESDIPALGAATSVRQVGEEGREWQQLQLSNFLLLLHVCWSPVVTGCPSLKCPSCTESFCLLFSVRLRFTWSKVLALLDIWPQAIFCLLQKWTLPTRWAWAVQRFLQPSTYGEGGLQFETRFLPAFSVFRTSFPPYWVGTSVF